MGPDFWRWNGSKNLKELSEWVQISDAETDQEDWERRKNFKSTVELRTCFLMLKRVKGIVKTKTVLKELSRFVAETSQIVL